MTARGVRDILPNMTHNQERVWQHFKISQNIPFKILCWGNMIIYFAKFEMDFQNLIPMNNSQIHIIRQNRYFTLTLLCLKYCISWYPFDIFEFRRKNISFFCNMLYKGINIKNTVNFRGLFFFCLTNLRQPLDTIWIDVWIQIQGVFSLDTPKLA